MPETTSESVAPPTASCVGSTRAATFQQAARNHRSDAVKALASKLPEHVFRDDNASNKNNNM